MLFPQENFESEGQFEIAAPEHPDELESEFRALPGVAVLHTSGQFSVAVTYRSQSESIIREIGRLRELSFRAVGEGTGFARDLDAFDDWYTHLFVWDSNEQRVLGAYRLGMTDVILRAHGPSGLYTNSLFHFSERYWSHFNPALELGRSFVCPDYQRSSRVLALLWRGIGQLVARRPRYRVLFGPVSVSANYSQTSRELIAQNLMQGDLRHGVASEVRAPRPLACRAELPSLSMRDLNRRVQELEPDGKGLPVLVKEYLKLGGKFLSFSVDPDFGNALDGLVSVDLIHTHPKLLSLYMGEEAYARFIAAAAKPAPAVNRAKVSVVAG